MELKTLSENIVVVPFERGGESVELSVNIDAFTPEFFRSIGKQFTAKMKAMDAEDKKKPKKKAEEHAEAIEFFESEARALEIKRDISATMLAGGLLTGWTVTRDGEPVEPTKALLMTLPPLMVEALWNACLKAAKTVKKRVDEEDGEISENMPSGSRGPLALAPTG